MDSHILEFYRAVRQNAMLFDELVATADPDDLIAAVFGAGAELGYSLTENDIREGLDAINDLVAAVADDEELNDFELAFVSGGGQTKQD